ncbi:hypothetical protein HRI_002341800 [Hibiscus trionum]|uniref:Reverse transcriptase zinc-binding domain-containing protein n=1 Tax=Hibiscus trionum TaxID=183268 RepID=A0A9W7I381_HIBTR|nr:hypothetical protein HRI_002341800 [Hibiscus trionum]
MFDKATKLGLFSGIDVGRDEGIINISHIQFADDLLMFSKASLGEIRNIKRVLRLFEIASGLQLNLNKCRLYGLNVEDNTLKEWASVLGCSVGCFPSDYLGLPLGIKRNSAGIWDPVVKKMHDTLASWKSSNLSFSGRLTMIKSVLCSIPIYYLSLFPVPSSVVKEFNRIMANFLWGGSHLHRKIHWVDWKSACLPTSLGGLGIRNISVQNRFLLSKWIWKFSNERNSLWKKVICAKYNIDRHSMEPGDHCSASYSWLWKGIVKSFYSNDEIGTCMRNNLIYQVGDGASIKFWSDWWIGNAPLMSNFPRIYALSVNKTGRVADFGVKDSQGWNWNVVLRRQVFDWELGQWSSFLLLLNCFKSSCVGEDCLVWKNSSDGRLSSKECYKLLYPKNPQSQFWISYAWQGLTPPRIDFFLWQVFKQRLPVKSELHRRGVNSLVDLNCPLCNSHVETINHLFFSCSFAWGLWMKFAGFWDINMVLPADAEGVFFYWNHAKPTSANDKLWKIISCSILWSLWLMRNDVVFKKLKPDPVNLLFVTKYRIALWFLALNPECSVSLDDIICNPAVVDRKVGASLSGVVPEAWSPPSLGFLKLNIDGAMPKSGSMGGIGGLIRDSSGVWVASFSEQCGFGPPIVAEIAALRRGLDLFMSIPLEKRSRLIIESDCKTLISWLVDPSSCPGAFKSGITVLAEVIKSNNCIVRHIPRAINFAADGLAKAGIG